MQRQMRAFLDYRTLLRQPDNADCKICVNRGFAFCSRQMILELLAFQEFTDFSAKPVMYQRYRCEPHWRTLLDWLEANGISARKKVHELRKMFGDAIVKRDGIFAGSAQL